jgi:hypothetical protein
MTHFIIGAAVIVLFLFLSYPTAVFVPGFFLKLIALVVIGIGCFILFAWLVPEVRPAGSRTAVESEVKDLYDSIVEVGKQAEFDVTGNYKRNTWLNERRARHESGYYEDRNGMKYYNAEEDMLYYRLGDGSWKAFEGSNTRSGAPDVDVWEAFDIKPEFETEQILDDSIWRQITNTADLKGSWSGTYVNAIPASEKYKTPAFLLPFTMAIRQNGDLFDLHLKLDMTNYYDGIMVAYPNNSSTKDEMWERFVTGSRKNNEYLEFGYYSFETNPDGVDPEEVLRKCTVMENADGTAIKVVVPKSTFGFEIVENVECILTKE